MSVDEHKLNEFIGKTVSDLAAGNAGVMVSIGYKLGLYKALAGAGSLSAGDVAARADCEERYVREWLNSQAAGGYVEYHAGTETFSLSPEQELVLADEDSPVHFPPAWDITASMWLDQEKTLQAFRTGDGIAWGDHSERLYCGVAAFYRNGYKADLVANWLPALEGVEDKLETGADVADIGCGHGHSTILMAQAYPNSRFYGYDVHPESIVAARDSARKAGVADRVAFEVADARNYPALGFDLICYFDCLHDLGDPVGAATHARRALAVDGTVMAVEPFANDRLEDNLNPVGRMYYSASAALCCAHSLSEEVGLALGAQAGQARIAQVFEESGFSSFRRAAETPFNLILEARA